MHFPNFMHKLHLDDKDVISGMIVFFAFAAMIAAAIFASEAFGPNNGF